MKPNDPKVIAEDQRLHPHHCECIIARQLSVDLNDLAKREWEILSGMPWPRQRRVFRCCANSLCINPYHISPAWLPMASSLELCAREEIAKRRYVHAVKSTRAWIADKFLPSSVEEALEMEDELSAEDMFKVYLRLTQ